MKAIVFVLIFSFLISFAGCTTDNPSNNQENENSEGVEVLDAAIEKELAAGESFDIAVEKNLGENYYLTVKYSSEVYMKGTIKYCDPADREYAAEESFFLEPKQDGEFCIFIGQEETENSLLFMERVLTGISFDNIEEKAGSFSVESMHFTYKDMPFGYHFLENDTLKLGINLGAGGGVFFLAYLAENVYQVDVDGKVEIGIDYDQLPGAVKRYEGEINLLNFHDVGRLVQQSYYGTFEEPYVPGVYHGATVPYNPVQGGDQNKNQSKIVDYVQTDTEIYVKCQPRDWAPAKLCDAYMENWYTLEDNTVKIRNRFTDFTGYVPRYASQEMPAVYTVRSLDNWKVYDGDAPFTDGELSTYQAQTEDLGGQLTSTKLSENWSALVNDDDFGVAVYLPDITNGSHAIFGNNNVLENIYDPYYNIALSQHNATSYITMIGQTAFESFKPLEYVSYLSAGRLSDMRQTFYRLHEEGANNHSFLSYMED